MKKVLALVLSLILVLSLVACGGGSSSSETSKDDLLAKAQPLSILSISSELQNNKARALNTYKDGVYTIWGIVQEINTDSVVLYVKYDDTRIRAFLPSDELMQLNADTGIQVVGTITNIQEETSQYYEYTFNYNYVSLENAHYITDVYEIKNTNVRSIVYSRTTSKYECVLEDNNFGLITINTGKITNAQMNKNNGNNFKVSSSGKLIYDGNTLIMDDSDFSISEY